MEEERNVISSSNVVRYIDDTSDGGFWFTVKDGEARFVAITDKALKIFGFDSYEQIAESNISPYMLIKPLSSNRWEEDQFQKFVKGERNSFNMDCTFTNVGGEEYYGQIFIAHSLVFPHGNDESLHRAMIHIYSPTEAIFRQTKQLIDGMNSGVAIIEYHTDNKFVFRYGNAGFCAVMSWSHENVSDLYGTNILDYIHEDDLINLKDTFKQTVSTGDNVRASYRVIDFDGNPIWIKAEHKKIRVGKENLIYINFISINEIMDIQIEMKKTNDRLTSFLNNTPAGIVVFEKKNEEYLLKEINTTMLEMLNNVRRIAFSEEKLLSQSQLTDYTIDEFIQFIDPIDRGMGYEIVDLAERSDCGEGVFKLNTNGKKEPIVWVHCKAIARKRKNGTMQLIAVYNDITRQVEAENEIKSKQAKIINMSYRDALTDVLNRQSYNEFIARRTNTKFVNTGVAFIDVNGLKVINDLYGHSKGDDALRLTVVLITHFFDKDEIYRLNGDNFLIIKENIAQEAFYGKVGKLIGEFNKYDIASIGYNWDDNVLNIFHNIDKAEAACRVAKHDYYSRHMEDESKHRPAHLNDLRNDIAENRYVIYLQPKAYTKDKKIIGAESLIRRIEPDGTIIPPSAFIPTIEKERLIPYIDFFMLRETCKVIERWNKQGINKIKISVNMSRVTFAEPEYIKKILEITDSFDIEHSQLEFEVTESQETMDRHALEQIIMELSGLGFGVSLDDMGTEYASVMMLTMKGLDTVKIDRGFVLQMKTERGRILVSNIIKMCHDLGEKCIAEGVETDEVRDQLFEMGCDMYQGYLLSEPIPVEEFEQLLINESN